MATLGGPGALLNNRQDHNSHLHSANERLRPEDAEAQSQREGCSAEPSTNRLPPAAGLPIHMARYC